MLIGVINAMNPPLQLRIFRPRKRMLSLRGMAEHPE